METESVLMQTLCVPCACRCRYCLLSWDGKTTGVAWERSVRFAEKFKERFLEERPGLGFSFSFGYSMEHPDLKGALRVLKKIGSPQAGFLQCDGMCMRNEKECGELMDMLSSEGAGQLNFTFYGLERYHDAFAGRKGEFANILRMMKAASEKGLELSSGIALTSENADQIDRLIDILNKTAELSRIFLFIPHEEGRGASIADIRFTEEDEKKLSGESLALLNREIFKTEGEWIREGFPVETKRTLIISLSEDNMERYESMDPLDIVKEIESLDEAYYGSFPSLEELAKAYGDPKGKRYYRQRDLFSCYRKVYAAEHGVSVYDVTDERQSGSRRY